MSIRRATHAGSWYTESARELHCQLDDWLALADIAHTPARAVIAPHAGYTYCGACSAFAYRQIIPKHIKHVFILGPSHHVRLSGCALSSTSKYRTPLYDLTIDMKIYDELFSTGCFERMSLQTDEDEHSIEMHLPYIAKVMEDTIHDGKCPIINQINSLLDLKCSTLHLKDLVTYPDLGFHDLPNWLYDRCWNANYRDQFTIIPILVGSLSTDKETQYGKILAHYLADPQNLFVISSDFCHWGHRFRYTYYDKSCGHIYQSVEKLDRMGMDMIEEMTPQGFSDYLKKFGNTICGRHPIGILLNAIQTLQKTGNGHKMSLKFLKYAQSSRCLNMHDSSVSYAAASLVFE